ncbi:hypothetical protein INT47_009243 [Mucor saturninus]|uniref:Transposase n=1 Tax=Mucor saturninus TaxID=64648 RepID=A0A8H7QJC3_9FUNG|nr:hypothetical protein INT47_009243 [Mucor saturninus]
MFAIPNANEVECRCSKCVCNPAGYMITAKRTAKRHAQSDKDRELDRNINLLPVQQSSVDVDMEAIQFEEDIEYDSYSNDVPSSMEYPDGFLPLSAKDFLFGTDELIEEYSSEHESSDEDAEEEEAEQSEESSANLPEDPWHRLIAIFLVMFISSFVVDEGAVILISFINAILEHYGESFRLPTSIPGLKKMTGYSAMTSGVSTFVACSDCHTLYKSNSEVPTCCTGKKLGRQNECGNSLFKSGISNGLTAKRTFVYNSLKTALAKLFKRPNFETAINMWNRGPKVPGTMFDVYDGKMWKEFVDEDGMQFVARERSLLLTLNIDWFQPFDGVTYSCGAIYLTINNLPRDERNKMENVILVGLMPGPKEASTAEINNYLRPLVNELEELYTGISIDTYSRSGALVRAALLMVACDIPAARKTCGFTSHNSRNACHKCNRHFFRFEGTSIVDYSGFNSSEWIGRTKEENRQHATMWKNARTLVERKQLEVENGVRWSELHRLAYFEPVRATIVDPMHNLFLGTAKRMMEKWILCGHLDDNDLCEMQVEANTITLPSEYASLTTKIAKGFPFMKADEWKSWCLIYSPVVLKGRLEDDLFANWIEFVDACRLLTKPTITEEEIELAHGSLERFCGGCEELYEHDVLSPNMHLHLHLKETINNFGPIYGYCTGKMGLNTHV